MDLYEYQARELFAAHGVPVTAGIIADGPQAAAFAADRLGYPAVVKAQVTIGGRGKAGGVKLVHSADEAVRAAADILGMDIRGHRVERLMVAGGVRIAREQYFSILVDRTARAYLSLFSLRGGMDIEQLAATDPDAIVRTPIDPLTGLTEDAARAIVRTAGGDEATATVLAPVMTALWDVFATEDATLVEVNPMVIDEDGAALALDAKVSLDGNAALRHDWDYWRGSEQPGLESRAQAAGLNYVKLAGQVGVLGNGAGRGMSPRARVAVAGRSACDPVVSGGLESLDRVDQDILKPLVLRLDGNQADAGRRLLAEAGSPWIHSAATMEAGADLAVRLASGEEN